MRESLEIGCLKSFIMIYFYIFEEILYIFISISSGFFYGSVDISIVVIYYI